MNWKITLLFLGIFLVTSASALTIDFYYSETCPYCQEIYPFVQQVESSFDVDVNYLNVAEIPEYNEPVPKFLIETNDNRQIVFTGADRLKLFCEAQEMSTRDCITYEAGFCTKESFFII